MLFYSDPSSFHLAGDPFRRCMYVLYRSALCCMRHILACLFLSIPHPFPQIMFRSHHHFTVTVSGICTALMVSLIQAACEAVYVHGLSQLYSSQPSQDFTALAEVWLARHHYRLYCYFLLILFSFLFFFFSSFLLPFFPFLFFYLYSCTPSVSYIAL